jgi:D-alanyl-D-alanine carboxypeptidase
MVRNVAARIERPPAGRPGSTLWLAMAIVVGLAAWLATPGDAFAKPAFSAIAVDAATGSVVYERDIDAPRYPASLTKVMTLYLLFEDMRAGKVSLSSQFTISAHAAAQQPSKLGLKVGRSISVRDAIGALVTKSANDIAVAVAEGLEGSETAFAGRMTRTARAIGMTRTTFRNASGLPDAAQKTTARDMATMGLRIQKEFPKEFRYFSTRSFSYSGRTHRNHNRLLGRVKGIDGIKTGYIRLSGFNLITSIERDGKRMVGVVMGGQTGGARNAYMTRMLDGLYKTAKLQSLRSVAAMAGNPPGYVARPGQQALRVKTPPLPRPKPEVPANDEKPTIAAVAASMEATDEAEEAEEAEEASEPAVAGEAVTSFQAVVVEPATKSDNLQTSATGTIGEAARLVGEAALNQRPPEIVVTALTVTWTIQIGAFPTPEGARSRLDAALASGVPVLSGKSAFTMKANVAGDTVYRARLSGFDEKAARLACKELKLKGVSCFPLAPSASAG